MGPLVTRSRNAAIRASSLARAVAARASFSSFFTAWRMSLVAARRDSLFANKGTSTGRVRREGWVGSAASSQRRELYNAATATRSLIHPDQRTWIGGWWKREGRERERGEARRLGGQREGRRKSERGTTGFCPLQAYEHCVQVYSYKGLRAHKRTNTHCGIDMVCVCV